MRLEDAIKQPVFPKQTSKLGVNLLYTSSWFNTELARTLKPLGLTWQQFNLMRIIRGQKGRPASLKTISERMIDRQSNTSRLVDKLVNKGLVSRRHCPQDRRQLEILLTSRGEKLLVSASHKVESLAQDLFGHMRDEDLAALNDLLDRLRESQAHSIIYKATEK